MAYLPPDIMVGEQLQSADLDALSKTPGNHRVLSKPTLYTLDTACVLSVLWPRPRQMMEEPMEDLPPEVLLFDDKLRGYMALYTAAVFEKTAVAGILLDVGATI
ncbi:hypothetical protein CGLO_05980 [Colletotrichum gloeosporioides Cg-14]|uniref:Uncharacterized protein n=1 Tax=Colletotrichum gloeosporioides (strain Cg-14) TaxID=1237896 RepID=T0KNT9_COLGC|nr:hypothetical protein CGLO_05980 [Colletotrichum gloeosporioides Cg-14]